MFRALGLRGFRVEGFGVLEFFGFRVWGVGIAARKHGSSHIVLGLN